jgi:hypothetical protein
VRDNAITGATTWSLEQAEPQANVCARNVASRPSRNVEACVEAGAGAPVLAGRSE